MPDPRLNDIQYDSIEVWNEVVGPFYDGDGVCQLLGIGPDTLHALIWEDRSVLALPTGDGGFIYPTRQFDSGGILSGWPEVLRRLIEAGGNPWTIATWAATRVDDSLRGLSPWEWLADGCPTKELMAEIDDLEWRWRQ